MSSCSTAGEHPLRADSSKRGDRDSRALALPPFHYRVGHRVALAGSSHLVATQSAGYWQSEVLGLQAPESLGRGKQLPVNWSQYFWPWQYSVGAAHVSEGVASTQVEVAAAHTRPCVRSHTMPLLGSQSAPTVLGAAMH